MEEGSLILYHEEGTNKILLGKESLYIWEDPKVDQIEAQQIIFSHINLNNFKEREGITKKIVEKVEAQLKKENKTITNWLVPPAVKSSIQANTNHNQIRYSSKARKEKDTDLYGAPKGGKEPSETVLQTMIREIKEEIGNLDDNLLPTDNDKYEAKTKNNYAIFYKKVSHSQARKIEEEIQRRYALHIGEIFDLAFRDIEKANEMTKDAFEKVQKEDQKSAELKSQRKAAVNVRTVTSDLKGKSSKPGASWAKPKKDTTSAAVKGGRRTLKKQRKSKKLKKFTRRR